MNINNNTPGNAASTTGKHEHPLPQEIKAPDTEAVKAAHDEAERDIASDADLSIHSPNDDLDEGETARLGDGENELI